MTRERSDRSHPVDGATAIGIDLGGTNLRAALIDVHGAILFRARQPTRAERGPEPVIEDMASMVERMMQEGRRAGFDARRFLGVGVGAPGPLRVRAGRILRMANLPGWDDVPLRDRLASRLETAVSLDNDGNAAALGEYWMRRGAGAESATASRADDLAMLTLGTGVGGGVILNGRILHGHYENAGELGHMIVVPEGEPCACGQRGCLERYASAHYVVQRVLREVSSESPCSLRGAVEAGQVITASQVAQAAASGDALCRRIWDEACTALARACVNIQHVVNPARIIFGGGMAQAGNLLTDPVMERFRGMTWSLYDDRPSIELSRLGADAGVIGAAALRFLDPTPEG